MKPDVKSANVAGMFYPGDKGALSSVIDEFLGNAKKEKIVPKAVIVPHAGYDFSGQVAAHAYKLFKNLPNRKYKVIILGPSHYAFTSAAFLDVSSWQTPLGDVKVADQSFFRKHDLFVQDKEAFAKEHSLEVQLPFLQCVLDDFEILPLCLGDVDPEALADPLIDIIDDDTLVVVSSDLSHFHGYEEAKSLDLSCISSIESQDAVDAASSEACGIIPIITMLHISDKLGLRIKLLEYKNSGDITGDKTRVVGYASFVFY